MADQDWNSYSLAELSKVTLGSYDIEDILDEVAEHSDREIAVIGGAIIDGALEASIRARCIELSNDDDNSLFSNNGALAPATAKLRVCHALGIITPRIFADIKRLNKIRNAFAHAPSTITFDTQAIAEACNALKIVDKAAWYEEAKAMPTSGNFDESGYLDPHPRSAGKWWWDCITLLSDEHHILARVSLEKDTTTPKARFFGSVKLNWILLHADCIDTTKVAHVTGPPPSRDKPE